nr:immunoglobulin light chain junction region [Macaca mulatta]
CQQHYDSPRTF